MRHFVLIIMVSTCLNLSSQNMPFPQHYPYMQGSIKPSNLTQTQMDNDVTSFYNSWKAQYFKNNCGTDQYYVWFGDEDTSAICVSEGQGYGMLIAAYMAGYDANAKTIFDGLYNFYKAHPSSINSNLMAWQQGTSCNDINGVDAATDGDMDIAYALLLADKQWGSSGAINYLQAANDIINAIMSSEINPLTYSITFGDWVTSSDIEYYATRPSDFMPDHFRAFYNSTSDNKWNTVIDECYAVVNTIQANNSPSTGLIPDFVVNCNTTPVPATANFFESPYDGEYYYNSCRVPWRLATDYLITGETRSQAAVGKINTWIENNTSADPANVMAGYTLSGGNISGNNYDDPSFIGPFAVGAMLDSANQSWLNGMYDHLIAQNLADNTYFGNTLKMLCLIVLSGNYWPPYTVSGIENIPDNSVIDIFPNPAKNFIQIKASGKSEIEILNIEGQIIKSISADESITTIDISELVSGMYFVKVKSEDGIAVKKFVKE
ncbi:MAG: glycosyl hydrolase family 8 [Bacteroidota bacterium]